MKRRLFAALGLALVLTVLTSFAVMAAEKKTYEFVVITHSASIDFWVPLVKGAQDAAAMINAANPNVEVTVRHTGPRLFNVSEQRDIMENVIEAGVDGIISTLPDPTAFDEPVAQALARGIPVIATNTDAGPDNPRLAYVGQGQIAAGRVLGRKLVDLIGTKGKVGIGIEDLGHTALQERLQGLTEVLDQTDIDYTVLVTTADLTQGASVLESYLIANPDAKAIVNVDANTQCHGVVLRNLGLKGKVVSAGFDLVPATLNNIIDGYTVFTIDQNPYVQGFYPVLALYLYHEYDIAPGDIDSGVGIVDASNVQRVIELAEQGYR
ncbi:MAG: sugar ABC transporter substrate-binding protein [Firmicutes bacterium]|jgi:simple sugar transport system substrate-binding protein|nr:sugar ABC transporter substrate-binding protein [Bacillota bacterium]